MKDREARAMIEKISKGTHELLKQTIEKHNLLVDRFNEITNALMTHLNLEFEDVKPGLVVRKKK